MGRKTALRNSSSHGQKAQAHASAIQMRLEQASPGKVHALRDEETLEPCLHKSSHHTGNNIHHLKFFAPTSQHIVCEKKKTGCQRKHERIHIVARSQLPAERYTLPRLLLKASGMMRALRVYSPSNNRGSIRRLHTPGFSSRCNGAVVIESPILENNPLKLFAASSEHIWT